MSQGLAAEVYHKFHLLPYNCHKIIETAISFPFVLGKESKTYTLVTIWKQMIDQESVKQAP